jgi:hypothetical protein
MACPKKVQYSRAGLESTFQPVNLPFGTSIHHAIEQLLLGNIKYQDMVAEFNLEFTCQLRKKPTVYPKTKNQKIFRAIGDKLMENFADYWPAMGIETMYVEKKVSIPLIGDVEVKGTVDFVGTATKDLLHPITGLASVKAGDTVVLDWKTAAVQEASAFAKISTQLSYYWRGIQLLAEREGFPPPSACGYADALKPNISSVGSKSLGRAVWHDVNWQTRSERIIREAEKYALFVAEKIRDDQFFRTPMMAYNSPCDGMVPCDFAEYCIEGSTAGLLNPKGADLIALAC